MITALIAINSSWFPCGNIWALSLPVLSGSGAIAINRTRYVCRFLRVLCEFPEKYFSIFLVICRGYRKCKSCIAISFFAGRNISVAFSPSHGYGGFKLHTLAISSSWLGKKPRYFPLHFSFRRFVCTAQISSFAFGMQPCYFRLLSIGNRQCLLFILFRFCWRFFSQIFLAARLVFRSTCVTPMVSGAQEGTENKVDRRRAARSVWIPAVARSRRSQREIFSPVHIRV